MSKHVAVLMGGTSSERAVSLSSGTACAAALEGVGYRVTSVDVGADVAQVLAELRSGAKPSSARLAGQWDVSQRTAERIIRAARALLQA